MRKKVILPTDFSKNSWNAIQYAIKLFENHDCDFYILNTYTTEAFGLKSVLLLDPDESLNKLSERRSREGLGDILERLMVQYPDTRQEFYMVSRAMTLLEAIEDLTNSLSIDLIVMGATGISSEREGKYGKKTLEIIENIRKCPVLVIPKDATYGYPEEIVLPTNFDTDFKASAVEHLAEIARIGNAHIKILSLTDDGALSAKQERNKGQLLNYFKNIDYSLTVLPNVKMADALGSILEDNKSNMISYIAKKPSFWEPMGFLRPTLGKLGYFGGVPVLALHE